MGKTTLVSQLLPGASYVSLDSPAVAERARLDPQGFLGASASLQIIDEVQNAPELFRHIKLLVDQDRRPGHFLLTGSQSFQVMAGVTESLAGRCALLQLPGLSFDELAAVGSLVSPEAFAWRGAYPELWQYPERDRDLWLGSYVGTCLERDIRNVLNIGSLSDFGGFLRAVALRAGQLLNYADLARDLGISPHTAKSWISVLEASQLVFLLEPYHRQRNKRLVKSPKLYFCDTGLLCHLMGFQSASELLGHGLWGSVWENLVVSELRKLWLVRGLRPPLWFWRTSDGYEIDLLVEQAPECFVTLECKAASEVSLQAVRANRILQREYGAGCVRRALVVCRTSQPHPLAEGVWATNLQSLQESVGVLLS